MGKATTNCLRQTGFLLFKSQGSRVMTNDFGVLLIERWLPKPHNIRTILQSTRITLFIQITILIRSESIVIINSSQCRVMYKWLCVHSSVVYKTFPLKVFFPVFSLASCRNYRTKFKCKISIKTFRDKAGIMERDEDKPRAHLLC